MTKTRFAAAVSSVALLATLAGCVTNPTVPMATYPSNYPMTTAAYPGSQMGLEMGRVVNIEYMPAGTNAPLGGNNILGAVVGGLAGAALGSTVGGGSGRTAATVLGGVAGAMAGNHIMRNQQGLTTAPGYRVTVQTDTGMQRMYEVSATGELRVGDRVRIENNVIYRA